MNNSALYDCVRAVNNTHRTALMNRKYYGYRLSGIRRLSITLEIVVAIGTSSAVGAWVIWKTTSTGETAWAILAGLAAVIATIKPFINLSRQIEKYTKLFVGHGDVYYDLKTITSDLIRTRSYSEESYEAFKRATERIKELAPDDDPKINKKLRRRCFDEVNREISVESLWWPKSQEVFLS